MFDVYYIYKAHALMLQLAMYMQLDYRYSAFRTLLEMVFKTCNGDDGNISTVQL